MYKQAVVCAAWLPNLRLAPLAFIEFSAVGAKLVDTHATSVSRLMAELELLGKGIAR